MQTINDDLLCLLRDAVVREMKVSMQYMLQHTLLSVEQQESKAEKFVGTHYPIFLPGDSLKKVAVTEMRHAESLAERLVALGGELPSQAPTYTIGDSAEEMMAIDVKEEETAIELYNRIIEIASSSDEYTANIFRKILSDEQKHLELFSAHKHKE